ncbi:MAG: 50S ribosomal protein L22 [Candidatus Glassbacteria bacterium]
MESKAVSRFIRISPHKARLVADMIRGKPVEDAYTILEFTRKRASLPILKTVKSAVSNVIAQKGTYEVKIEDMYISEIRIDEGPMLKRYRPMAMGRAGMIRRRTSHISVVVKTRSEVFED